MVSVCDRYFDFYLSVALIIVFYYLAGVLLLDADVILPCNDLAFAQTVWRSSGNAQVGFFPRSIGW